MQSSLSKSALSHPILGCILCRSPRLRNAVSLAAIPIATPVLQLSNLPVGDADPRRAAALQINQCEACGHLQLSHAFDPTFEYTDHYIYKTSLSVGLNLHFEAYASDVLSTLQPAEGSLVVEFGSSDGTMLQFFKKAGMRVLGVEPAKLPAQVATEAGIETIVAFFNAELAGQLRATYGAARIIVANNVIANIEDLDDVARGVKSLLADDGVFVFETQYGGDVVDRMLIDTIYHEHLSYFLLKPLVLYFERHGMEIVSVQRGFSKGGSVRIMAKGANEAVRRSHLVDEMLQDEERRRMFSQEYFDAFSRAISFIKSRLHEVLSTYSTTGVIAGYGVSAGTTTLLAQFDIASMISFLVDDDPNKGESLAGPDYAIPIRPAATVAETMPSAVVIFAWRYWQAITRAQADYRAQGGRFVLPLPCVSVLADSKRL